MFRENGNHTWDLHLKYYECNSCGFIIEDRKPYKNVYGKHFKDVTCDRCQHKETIEKKEKPSFGPLINAD